MTTPYTPYSPTPPKRLLRSRSDRILGGVCGGTAAYLNMDPTLVRVLTALITLFTGVPVIVYLVMLFVVPEEDTQPPGAYPPVQPQADPVRPAEPQPGQEHKPQDPRV